MIDLQKDVKYIKGVGPKKVLLLNKLGIFTLKDLITYYPRTYEDRSKPKFLYECEEGEEALVEVIACSRVSNVRLRGKTMQRLIVRDETDSATITWFNQPYLKDKFNIGEKYKIFGKVSKRSGKITFNSPTFDVEEQNKNTGRIIPIYPLTFSLSQNNIRKIMEAGIAEVYGKLPETLPDYLLKEYKLENINEATKQIHFPNEFKDFNIARNRLVFEELLSVQLALLELKNNYMTDKKGIEFSNEAKMSDVINSLPFKLTKAQLRVLEEIDRDMESSKNMNRLLQGDVGSGKTIVAFLSMYQAALCHYQSALMAPTEVLASQHYQGFTELSERYHLNLSIVLLTGSMRAGQKKEALRQIREHEADIVIGTHAVIQEKVEFDDLALVITDEQHRFGVAQRDALSKKGHTPHVLVMSATPIPRSLAMILYGDLDISIMDELPAKRLPIKNCVVNISYRPKAWDFIIKQVQAGHQAYVICPMVEESETSQGADVVSYTEQLREALPSYISIEYLHGKMKAKEKDDIMAHFAKNETQVLVSTTVIEVGINVPNATVILIEDAQRFGLAQLHQLRGRVGRGDAQSYCIMIDTSGKEESAKRLEVLNHSNDGFAIANEDLKLRGPGDFFGIRQSGEIAFAVADIYQDAQLLKWAKEAADSAQVMAAVETHSI